MIFSKVYDEFYSTVSSALSDHLELDDNVIVENNNERKLAKGFSVTFQGANNTDRLVDCMMSVKQTVVVINTLANYGNELDLISRKRAEKEILENCYKLVKEIENNSQLNGVVELVRFESHNGVELIIDSEDKIYYMIQATYSLEWFKHKEEN